MRCLYCGKELALLKRLRGGGDFCSDAHKQSYQEEYNRLALSRLLQAQKKGQPGGQTGAPPPHAVAVEEPAPYNQGPAGLASEHNAPVVVAADPELNGTAIKALVPERPHAALAEESPANPAGDAMTPLSTEPEPVESAGFLFESPAVSALPEEAPRLEPWLELSPGPAMSEWQIQNGAFSLSSAGQLSLHLQPQASSIAPAPIAAGLAPQALASAQPGPRFPQAPKAKKTANHNRLASSSVIGIDIAPSSAASEIDRSFVAPIGLETTVLLDDSPLLDLWPTAIHFPSDDADVVVAARRHDHEPATDIAPLELAVSNPETEADTPETLSKGSGPRASLQALSRLHQELAVQEEARAAEPVEAPVQVLETAALQVVATPVAVAKVSPEPRAGSDQEARKPKCSSDLFEISIKPFPPPKPVLIGGDTLRSHIAPLLPHLKFLPLRPKVALATGYVPPSKVTSVSEAKPAEAATVVRTPTPAKGAVISKPAARLTQPKQPSQPPKAVQAAIAPPPEARTAAPKAEAAKPVASTTASQSIRLNSAEAGLKTPPAEKDEPAKPAGTASTSKSSADQTKAVTDKPRLAAEQKKPAAGQPKLATEQTNKEKENVPSFGIAAPNISWLGSLKVKLGLAIVLLVIACAYFLGWGGGKSSKPANSNTAVSADGSGPSIIMGEGGWVEDWAGDPAGMHAGREITIYRPSLKLSDYRLEFQASIDTKSVGWVFRAADPNNYYAMKLMTVSSGLTPKVALFKYLVANGRQTQVGRVPIDLAVQADQLFDIRVDVRGAQFTTYIQGQQVDSWTDDQLKTGGAGFLNEREERGKVKSVSIRYLSGAAK